MMWLVKTLVFLGFNKLATKLYFWKRHGSIRKKMSKQLRRGNELRRHTFVSKDVYQDYTDREQIVFDSGEKSLTIHKNVLQYISGDEIRKAYLEPMKAKIRELIERNDGLPVRVLEIGCGNCINLSILTKEFGDSVDLYGIDISPQRLKVSKEYWGDRLKARLQEASATDLSCFDDSSFDLVYSSCCLEQIPYRIDDAVAEMLRVSSAYVVFVEPTYDFGNPTQKLYTIYADQCRTLLPELKLLNANIVASYPLSTLHTPVNMVGATVVDVR